MENISEVTNKIDNNNEVPMSKSDKRKLTSSQNLAKARQAKLDMLKMKREEMTKQVMKMKTTPKIPQYVNNQNFAEKYLDDSDSSGSSESDEEILYVQPIKSSHKKKQNEYEELRKMVEELKVKQEIKKEEPKKEEPKPQVQTQVPISSKDQLLDHLKNRILNF